MDIPKISVYVITYNQEDVIHRTMDSLLEQKEYLYEICINDDCSKDKTFEILLDYQKANPELVKPVRNDHNLGIFANMEAVMSRLTGDVVFQLSGDDVCPNGYFKSVIDFIKNNHIDYQNELFCIYGDYMEVEPDGSSITFSNGLVKKHDALKLKIRQLISNRSACYSKKLLDKFEKVSDGHSFSVEWVQDAQLQLYSEKNYHLPVVGNVYYAGIGISTRMTKEDRLENIFRGFDRLLQYLGDHNYYFDKKDRAYIEFTKYYRLHEKKLAIKYYLKSIDISLGIKGLGLDRIFFVIKKKINRKDNKLNY